MCVHSVRIESTSIHGQTTFKGLYLLAMMELVSDSIARHVRVHHQDKDRDDPELRAVLVERFLGIGISHQRRANTVGSGSLTFTHMKTYPYPNTDGKSPASTQDKVASPADSELESIWEPIWSHGTEKRSDFSAITTPGSQVDTESPPETDRLHALYSIVENVECPSAPFIHELADTTTADNHSRPAPWIIKYNDKPPSPATRPDTPSFSVTGDSHNITTEPERQSDISNSQQMDAISQEIIEDGALQDQPSWYRSPPTLKSSDENVSDLSGLPNPAKPCEERSGSLHVHEDAGDILIDVLEASDNTVKLANIVEDLKQRIVRLLQLSRPQALDPSPAVSNLTEQLSPRLPVDWSPLSLGTQDLLSTPESHTWTTPGARSSPYLEFCSAFNRVDNVRRTRYRQPQRASSAPPAPSSRGIQEWGHLSGCIECTTGQSSATVTNSSQSNPSSAGKGSLKRAACSSDTGDYSHNQRNDDEDRDRPSKRGRINCPEPSEGKARLPCIFNVGESERFATHTKRYQHISGLL